MLYLCKQLMLMIHVVLRNKIYCVGITEGFTVLKTFQIHVPQIILVYG